MKTVALEGLMLDVIVSFCENAAELGCPKNQEVDMWIREMEIKKALKVMEKLLDIMERNDSLSKDLEKVKQNKRKKS